MSISDEQPTAEQRPSGIGPGERLQAARIQQGLSIDDVAERMHLSSGILEAIEENNFEEITAPIFVKGYLRAYARMVGLDEDEMIQQYAQYYSGEDPPISSTSNMAPELSVADARIKWTTYLVVIVLATLLAAWWWNKEQNQSTPISLDGGADSGIADAEPAGASEVGAIEAISEQRIEPLTAPVTEPAPAMAAAEARPETAETAEQGGSAAGEAPPPSIDGGLANQSPSIEAAQASELPAQASEPPAQADGGESTDQIVRLEAEPEAIGEVQQAPAPAASEAADAEPPVRNLPSLIAPTGSDKLRLTVYADSWADIKDSTGFQMVYDLFRADRSVEMTGQAPFSVFLGNGHGVEIWFNDDEVDFSSRIRNDNTARLEIGG